MKGLMIAFGKPKGASAYEDKAGSPKGKPDDMKRRYAEEAYEALQAGEKSAFVEALCALLGK